MEDDKTARRAISLILKRHGFSVSEAGTVAEAMSGLAFRPDWVLLDLMLPDGCGSEVLRRVGAEELATRVCVITGCGPEKLDEVRALHPEHILNKPIDVDRLVHVLTA